MYGLLSDNFPIAGYKRKYYLMMNGFLGFLALSFIFPDQMTSISLITICLCLNMATAASTDVLSDSLSVVEAKKDKDRGSEDLQTLSFGTYSIFGIIGAILGAVFT